jgi:hypothetical protein
MLTEHRGFIRQCECVDWIHLVDDRVHWRALVNTIMNLNVHEIRGNR